MYCYQAFHTYRVCRSADEAGALDSTLVQRNETCRIRQRNSLFRSVKETQVESA